MKVRSRFIKAVIESARAERVAMPWARGTRRAAWIARRDARQDHLRRA
ncbi:MAG: hypothetical protein ACLFRU_09130 [Paracoccaceae bacterium]